MAAVSDLKHLRQHLVDLRRDAARRGNGVDADVVKWATEVETLQQLIDSLGRSIADERRSARRARSSRTAATRLHVRRAGGRSSVTPGN